MYHVEALTRAREWEAIYECTRPLRIGDGDGDDDDGDHDT